MGYFALSYVFGVQLLHMWTDIEAELWLLQQELLDLFNAVPLRKCSVSQPITADDLFLYSMYCRS